MPFLCGKGKREGLPCLLHPPAPQSPIHNQHSLIMPRGRGRRAVGRAVGRSRSTLRAAANRKNWGLLLQVRGARALLAPRPPAPARSTAPANNCTMHLRCCHGSIIRVKCAMGSGAASGGEMMKRCGFADLLKCLAGRRGSGAHLHVPCQAHAKAAVMCCRAASFCSFLREQRGSCVRTKVSRLRELTPAD